MVSREDSPGHNQLLDRLEQRTGDDTQSWSLACHDYLLLKAAYLGWRDAYRVSLMPLADARVSLANPAQPPASGQTGEPAWCGEFESRLTEIAASLQFGSTEFEWPAYEWAGLPGPIPTPPLRNLATIRQRLQSLVTELRQHYASRPAVTQHGGSF